MKRFLTVFLLFCILAVPFLSGCTLTCDGESCRGLGYELGACYAEACSCVTVEDDWSNMYDLYDSVVEGVDYSKPEINFIYDGGTYGELSVSMEVYEEFRLYEMEILFIQDGIILYEVDLADGSVNDFVPVSTGSFSRNYSIYLNEKNENGGEVYYIVNSFVANKMR